MTHDRPHGLFQYIKEGAGRRGRRMNSGKLYDVDNKRLKLSEVVAAAGPGANMSAARRDIVQGAMSAQAFVDKYRKPTGGYAPGNYTCKCCRCGAGFTGDKRAVTCFKCANMKGEK